MGGNTQSSIQSPTYPVWIGPGPKELSGLYQPSPYTPKPEPEQEQEFPDGMVRQPNVRSKGYGPLFYSTTAEFDGVTYVLPKVVGDQKFSDQEAIQRFLQTGEHFGAFDSLDSANAWRNNDDEILDDYYSP